MNRKRSTASNVNPQSKRLKTPFATQGSSSRSQPPSTNAMALWDRDGLAGLQVESPTAPPFKVQYQRTVFPLSIPPLAIGQTVASISSIPEVSPPQSIMHQGVQVQSHEVLYGSRPGGVAPSYYSDWDVIPAIEEHDQTFQGTQIEDLEENYFQRALCAEDISAQSGVNVLSDTWNCLSEGSPQPSLYLIGNQVFNDQEASSHRTEKFTPSLSMLGTSIHDPCDSWRTMAEVYNVSHSQSLYIAVPSHTRVAQFPMQNKMFQSAQNVHISGNARLMNIAGDSVTNVVKDGTHGLEKMEKFVSFTAQFDSSAQDPERICHPGTRQNVLRRMKDWIDNPSSTEPIFWLYGPAGAGKSAIAQTIAQSCSRQQVPASFFFFRSDPGRNDGNMLFTTLAYQLAFSIPAMKHHIATALHERPDLPTKSVEIQFNDLIALPFRSLVDAASQQSFPGSVIDAINQFQQLAPVIIIDGVDECTEEKVQQRFLKIIGDAVKNSSFPFRFLICSRPEAHIEDTLNKFKSFILSIDLAKLDDANRDIEKYLLDQFSSIASNRGLNSSWPGRDVIENIVFKSSGNFILASVVIKFASDEDSMPEDQIAIILNLKPPDRMSPFAVLDELYLEILKRQLYQDFFKTFLALLVGRTELSLARRGNSDLHEDDAKLMNVSDKELHTKLRRMRSLLKFEPHIDVHHRSFLDFLNEPARSGDYHVSKQRGTKRYLELVVDSIVRYASRVIHNPDYHEPYHFNLKFRRIIWDYPLKIDLPIEELQGVSRPLVKIQDEILALADSRVATDLLSCDKCAIFQVIRHLLLHLAIHRCIEAAYNEVGESATKGKRTSVIPSFRHEATQSALCNDLDISLSSLLTYLQETKLELSPSTAIVKHMSAVLRFDCAEIVVKVRFMSDAQRLVDFLLHLIDEKYMLSQYKPDGLSKAARLILNIVDRIPILPQSLFQNTKIITSGKKRSENVGLLCEAALMSRVLDQNYIHLEINLHEHSLITSDPFKNSREWKQVLPLDSIIVLDIVLEVAKAIQYLHSMGIVPSYKCDFEGVYYDLSLYPKVRLDPRSSILMNPFTKSTIERSLQERSVLGFGCFFYSAYFKRLVGDMERKRHTVATLPYQPEMPEYAWQLIQRCCAKDPSNRPTIGEVVEEMETWRNRRK